MRPFREATLTRLMSNMPSAGPAEPLYFLDTNIFIRHLTNDHPVQSPACLALIRGIEQGRVKAWTSDMVISEIVFVLVSKHLYNLSRAQIRDLILPLINLPGLRLSNKRMYRRVFELFTSLPIDYVDAYNAALIEARGQLEIYSYDAHFDRIPTISRTEP